MTDRIRKLFGICCHEWSRWGYPVMQLSPLGCLSMDNPRASQRRTCTACGQIQQRTVGESVVGDDVREQSVGAECHPEDMED